MRSDILACSQSEWVYLNARSGEYLGPVKRVIRTKHAVTGRAELGIRRAHDICTMSWTVQPGCHHYLDRLLTGGNIFPCGRPVVASVSDSISHGQAIRSGVAEKVVVSHIPAVRICGIIQGAMPGKGRNGGVIDAAAIAGLRPGDIDLSQHLLVIIRHTLVNDVLAGIAEVI